MADKIETASDAVKATVDTVADVTTGVMEETKTMLHLDELLSFFTWPNIIKFTTSVLAIVLFYIVYKVIKHILKRRVLVKTSPNTAQLVNKVVGYVFWVLMAMYVLGLFGINLSAIWGAAGVAGLAIGFAAQTSVSNIISGMFVLSEKAMKIGDYITCGDVSGTVSSIDLLSIKIVTPNNQMIRIPNSTIINGSLINYSQYDTRRLDFIVSCAYESDMDKVLEALKKVPSMCPLVLQDPAPLVFFNGFGASGIDIKICVWLKSADQWEVRNQIYKAIIQMSREAPFEIPYNKLDVNMKTPSVTA